MNIEELNDTILKDRTAASNLEYNRQNILKLSQEFCEGFALLGIEVPNTPYLSIVWTHRERSPYNLQFSMNFGYYIISNDNFELFLKYFNNETDSFYIDSNFKLIFDYSIRIGLIKLNVSFGAPLPEEDKALLTQLGKIRTQVVPASVNEYVSCSIF